jgi:hypothetical protein
MTRIETRILVDEDRDEDRDEDSWAYLRHRQALNDQYLCQSLRTFA